jgi:hypothetical protein
LITKKQVLGFKPARGFSKSIMNTPSDRRIAGVISNHAMILPHGANQMEFSEKTTPFHHLSGDSQLGAVPITESAASVSHADVAVFQHWSACVVLQTVYWNHRGQLSPPWYASPQLHRARRGHRRRVLAGGGSCPLRYALLLGIVLMINAGLVIASTAVGGLLVEECL